MHTELQAAPMPHLRLVIEDRGTTRLIMLRGELDLAAADGLRQVLATAFLAGPETVVADLGDVTFIDPAGVHLLLDAHARAQGAEIRLVLLPARPQVQRIFDLCGVSGVLPFGPAEVFATSSQAPDLQGQNGDAR